MIMERRVEWLRKQFRRHLAPHRHSALLVAILTAFAVRPLIGDWAAGSTAFSLALMALLLVALYAIDVDEMIGERGRLLSQSRRRRYIGWALGIASGLDRILAIFLVHKDTIILVGTISWFLFLLFVTFSELRSVLKQREVTGETICMAISIYLLLGFTWALLYAIMFQLHPDSFGGLGAVRSGQVLEVQRLFPVLGYFSLTTLSTIGFGDITPLSLQARYAAVAEGITGQFYMAVLVARLVGLQMSRSQRLENEPRLVAE
jgi:hypothetical protein